MMINRHRHIPAVKSDRVMKKNSGRNYFWLGFLVPLAITLISFIVIGIWPFGDNTALKVDSIHQYLPFYTDFHDKLRRGEDLLYSFSAGMGYDFWSTFAYYIACPLNFLSALLPTKYVCDFMDLMMLLKIGLCGGTFAWYLHKRDPQSRFMPVVFAAMFATSNFIIGYYFNLMWLDSIAMLPLIMYGIEEITRGHRGRFYCLALFYSLWCNYYIGFMLCIFSVLYLFACFVQREQITWQTLLKRSVVFGWYSLLAGGMSAVLLMPAYLSLTASESMESNSFPSVIKFYTGFIEMIKTHFVTVEPLNISDTQVGLNAYCGVIVLLLVLCYILDTQIALRTRLSMLALTAFVMLSFSMNVLNYIWHGFHQQNGLPNRFAFIYICLLLVMCFDVFGHLRQMALWRLAAGCVVPIVFTLWLAAADYDPQETYAALVFLTPILLTVYALLILTMRLRQMKRLTASLLIGGVMIAEAAGHDVFGFVSNGSVARSTYLKDQASYKALTAATGDEDFYRSEIDSQRMRNVTMFAGGHSIVLFNSTMDAAVTNFCDRLGIEARTNKNGYNGVTKLMNDVFGIRYVLSSNGKADTLYQFEKVDEDGNLTIYRNSNALSIGFMCDSLIRYWDIESGDPIEVQNAFVRLATGLDDLYVLDRTVDAEDGENYGVRIPEDKQVYLYVPSRIDSLVLSTPEYSRTYSTYTDHLYVINGTDDEDLADFTTNLKSGQSSVSVKVYTCPNEAYQTVIDTLAESQLEDVEAAGRHLSGTIDAQKDGILLLTVPYDEDWKVKVDGEEVSTLAIADALMGIELTAGTHEIVMTYTPRGLWPGLALSLLSLTAFILTILAGRKKEQKEKNMKLHFSKIAESFSPGIFTVLNEKKEALEAQGMKIHNLSVGTPDFAPPAAVMEAVAKAASDPENYKYSLKEMPELIEAMQEYYLRRFGVTLESDEIMTVNGSQEGIAHIAWALCDPGDIVLVPNPGYPIFKMGPTLCGARVWEYPLTPEHDYLPKLDEIPEDILSAARFMVISYPGNPLCKAAPDSFYEEVIAFAKKWDIILVHDNAYADIDFTPSHGKSFLSFEGAKDVGVEFYSLSKTFDYTGARLSFVLGNVQIIRHFQTIRSQIDYGVFYPVQLGAIAALREPEEGALAQCAAYEKRSRTFCAALRSIGWEVPDTDGTMFVWAPLPKGYTDSEQFCLQLMEKSGVICTPGSSFGSLGEGYVRFALVEPPEELERAAQAIGHSGILDGR